MKQTRTVLIVVIMALVALLLAACEQPTPTPPTSPLPSPPEYQAQAQAQQAVVEPGTVTGTVEVWWDSPLVSTGFVTIYTGVEPGGSGYVVYHVHDGPNGASVILPGAYVVHYICEGPDAACAGYPATRTVHADTAVEACAVTMTLVLDFEARQDGAVYDAATKTGGPLGPADEPGHGQYDGTIPWRWTPLLSENIVGVVEVWRRARWADEGLPDIVIPFDVNGTLRTPDEHGFFLVAAFEIIPKPHTYYLPIVCRRGR